MFQAIRDYSGWFVGSSSEEMFLDKEKVEEESKKGRTRVIESLPAHIQAPTCNLLEVLFPRTGQHPFSSYGAEWEDVWRRKSLLASQDRLQFYLRRGVPPGQVSSETINVILSDTEARDEVLETLIKEKRFEGFLTRVNDFIDDNKINDISHFLKTLTSVVEKDQDALPDKHGFTGTSFVMMTWWAVRKVIENVEPQNRENLIMELCDNPNALSVSEILVLAIQRQHGKFGGDAPHPEEKQLVTLRVADKAKTQWLISVKKSAADMSLVKARAFGSILFSWKRFGKKEDAQKFIADLLKTEDGLAQFMSGIASRIESSSGTSYECNPSILKEFVKVEKIYKLCKQKIKEPKFDELSERAKQAIQSFVSLNEQSSSVI